MVEATESQRWICRNLLFHFKGISPFEVNPGNERPYSVRASTCSRFAKNCVQPLLAPP